MRPFALAFTVRYPACRAPTPSCRRPHAGSPTLSPEEGALTPTQTVTDAAAVLGALGALGVLSRPLARRPGRRLRLRCGRRGAARARPRARNRFGSALASASGLGAGCPGPGRDRRARGRPRPLPRGAVPPAIVALAPFRLPFDVGTRQTLLHRARRVGCARAPGPALRRTRGGGCRTRLAAGARRAARGVAPHRSRFRPARSSG